MSTDRNRTVTVAALVVLAATLGLTWQLAAVRATQAVEHRQSALVDDPVTERRAPADWDGDGHADGDDRCPTRPETTNGFQDGDGCPDVVATSGAS
jgi:hypothetical protein